MDETQNNEPIDLEIKRKKIRKDESLYIRPISGHNPFDIPMLYTVTESQDIIVIPVFYLYFLRPWTNGLRL